MSSPSQEFFFPLKLDNLAHIVRKSKHPIRGRIVGEGKVDIGESTRRFFVFKMPIGDGSTGRFPILVPEDMVKGDKLEVLLVKEQPAFKMIFEKKKGRIATAPEPRTGARLHVDSYVLYQKIEKEWALVQMDDRSFMEEATKKVARNKIAP